MDFIKITNNFYDPENNSIEIVERKGLGHPDTLADALAELVSLKYSKYCLEKFGAVLHHNVDKLYIGAGHFKNSFSSYEMLEPVKVKINGRMSNSFGDQKIDIARIEREAVLPYLFSVLPNLKEDQVVVEANSTQYTKNENWFSPRDLSDIPDASNLKANDTSVVLFHWPMTISEKLAYELEAFFWDFSGLYPKPKFERFGQDIKVMVSRQDDFIEATLCVPIIGFKAKSLKQYYLYVNEIEKQLNQLANKIVLGSPYSVVVKVNPYQRYVLGLGSCIECGEEGLVGRGNSSSGVISIYRSHSMEAWPGKNPVYHTGRVMGFLVERLAKALVSTLNVKCSVLVMTRNGDSLIPPYLLQIDLDKEVDKQVVESLVNEHFINVDYLTEILSRRIHK